MLVRGIDDVLIYFICYHITVILDDNICYRLEFFTSEHLATRIRRITEHQSLCAVSESIFKQIGIKLKCGWYKRDIYRLCT